MLTVAERNYQREEGGRICFDERPEGSFRRQVTLGEGFDADVVEADYTDGVLTLRIPTDHTTFVSGYRRGWPTQNPTQTERSTFLGRSGLFV